MQLELKPLSKDAIPNALEKAVRYRLLNQPGEAESICLDVLRADPENQDAIVNLILSMTDQFANEITSREPKARALVSRLRDNYKQAYYTGVIIERHAKAALRQNETPSVVYEYFKEAMEWYEKAFQLRPAGNEDSILRFNRCVRVLARYKLTPSPVVIDDPYID